MEQHKRIGAVALAVVLLLAACSGDTGGEGSTDGDVRAIEDVEPEPEPDPEPVEAEEPEDPEPEPDPEPAEIDITVVPDEITEEYVEAVLVELERVYAETVAEFRRADGELVIEVTDGLGEIFSNETSLDTNIEIFQNVSAAGFPNIREADSIGPRRREVLTLISGSSECIYAETLLDAAELVEESGDDPINFVELVPKRVERPVVLNESSWVYGRVLVPQDEDDRVRYLENDPCA